MNPGDRGATRLTPTDVAYIELAMLLRERRERSDMRHLIRLALERGTPSGSRLEVGETCRVDAADLVADDDPIANRGALPQGVLTVVSDCAPFERQN